MLRDALLADADRKAPAPRPSFGKVAVVQLGARMHYAVPRILAAHGELAQLYTDICASQGWPRLVKTMPSRLMPAAIRRLAGRVPTGVPEDLVTSFPGFGLAHALRRLSLRTASAETAAALWGGRHLSRLVARRGFGDAAGVYAFSGECLGVLAAARAAGLWTAVEQIIAPRTIVDCLVAQEEERFPGWQAPTAQNRFAEAFAAEEKAEWAMADVIICGSHFVRDGVIAMGGDPQRTIVVPYGIDRRFSMLPRRPRKGRLRVLTVGGIGLRKGSPYVLEAAKRLAGRAEFRMVGPCPLLPGAKAALSSALELIEGVPRAQIREHYAWADVFLLPSICEGSATATYEALAAGLPVITTPNAGSVVRDGIDGHIVAIRDVEAIVAHLDALAHDRARLSEMARSASARAADYDLDHYGERLRCALGRARDLQAAEMAAEGSA
jgi:glycosyltransferase involved in cell wall biosynthesis